MAHYAKKISFLFFVSLFISLPSHGRESKFFVPSPSPSTLAPSPTPELASDLAPAPELASDLAPAPALASVLAPAPALALDLAPEPTGLSPAPSEGADCGYGLYGHGSTDTYETPADMFSTDPESYKENIDEDQLPTKTKYFHPGGEIEIPPQQLMSTQSYEPYDSYANNNYNYNYNGNGNGNGYMSNRYNVDRYVTGPQGMSDTRTLENGKYYYNNGASYNEPMRGIGNGDEGYYRNNEGSKYEFDTMDEYDKQEGYPDSQRDYLP